MEHLILNKKNLRQKAEEQHRLVQSKNKKTAILSSEDVKRTLHELQVHQIELEMQNEELLRIHQELDSARSRYFELYDFAPVGYFTLCEAGKILETNLCSTVMLGRSRTEIVSKRFVEFIYKADRDIFYFFLKRLKTSVAPQAQILRMEKPNEGFLWVQLTADVRSNDVKNNEKYDEKYDEKEQIQYRVVMTDFTQQKLAEVAHIEAKLAAESANRAKTAFLSNMSHELRTPLNAVLGFTQLLSRGDLPKEKKEFLGIITNAGRSLLQLVNSLLDIAKIEADKLELNNANFDFFNFIDLTIKPLYLLANTKKISMTTAISPDISKVYCGDSIKLSQILSNLVDNAIKFTKAGEVKISVNLISSTLAEDVVQFIVSDTGIGMSEETQKIIFLPFTQGDGSLTREYGGTGLGLTISKALVTLMGGDLQCVSENGHGSTFSFEIPMKKVNNISSIEKSVGGSGLEVSKIKVLLVEDSPTNICLEVAILDFYGCETKTATCVSDGLELLENEDFDLLLIDIQLPKVSGLEMIKAIREKEKFTTKLRSKAIAISAHSMTSQVKEFFSAGFDGYISKPIDMDQMMGEMDRVMKTVGSGNAYKNEFY